MRRNFRKPYLVEIYISGTNIANLKPADVTVGLLVTSSKEKQQEIVTPVLIRNGVQTGKNPRKQLVVRINTK